MKRRTRVFIERQWDTLLALISAAVLSVLSAIGVVTGDAVSGSALAVLAIVSVALVKDRESREDLLSQTAALNGRLAGNDAVCEIPVAEIGFEILLGTADTTFWRFKGGTGTYMRAETLPRLSAGAPTEREVWIEILDPTDPVVCRTYADYRRRAIADRSVVPLEEWTLHRVRTESFASIIAAAWFSQHRNLRIHVGLTSKMSVFRHDMSSRSLVITNEDPASNALKVPAGVPLYYRYNEELIRSYEQSRQLDMSAVPDLPGNQLGADTVRRILGALDLMSDDTALDDTVLAHLGNKAISSAHARELGFQRGEARNPYPPPQ